MKKTKNQLEMENRYKSGELKHIILAALGVSVIMGGTFLVTPNFPIVLATILKIVEELKNIKLPKRKVMRVLKQLEKEEIISLSREEDQVKVILKDHRNTKIIKYSIKEILALKKRKKEWKGKWYVVTFDVPEKQKNKRDYLRRFLYEIGFYPYQKSVYIYPYECEKEITLIKNVIESGNYLNFIVADRLDNQEKLLTYFKIVH